MENLYPLNTNSLKKHLLLLVFLFSIAGNVFAQEEVIPLNYNPVIKNFLNSHPTYIWGRKGVLGKGPFNDSLPFIEDFSTTEIYPDSSMWMDNNVYINNNFPVKPPSAGVATFDGLNKYGEPYDNSSSGVYGPCDTLTSKTIVMGYTNNYLKPSDSVFMSFYVQNQGRGDEPEQQDSLVLQFKNDSNSWVRIWSIPGSKNTGSGLNGEPFKQFMIGIRDSIFFHDDFQFRFFNYGNRSGSLNHWHLDYIVIHRNRKQNDTSHADVAISYTNSNFLKTYRSMPWKQFLLNTGEKASSHEMVVRSLDKKDANVQFEHKSFDFFTKTQKYEDPNSSLNVPNNGFQKRTLSLDTFPIQQRFSGDTVIIDKRYRITASPSDNAYLFNDTLHQQQVFSNYYAYDDGSAEAGYGINFLAGKVAYKFHLNQADTLRAISVFFNRSLENISARSYSLMVWSKITDPAKGHDDEDAELRSELQLQPYYTYDVNGFYTIHLDTPVKINAGDFYIGWAQNSVYLLNVGLDRNYPNNEGAAKNPNLFYNIYGYWEPSRIEGTIMMRPHFSQTPLFASARKTASEVEVNSNITLFPNPASSRLWIKDELNRKLTYEVYGISGNLIDVQSLDNSLEVSRLKAGTYILKISEVNSTKVIFTKFIVVK